MTERYTIRPFRPSDSEYEAIVRVYNLANPHDQGAAATWQHWDKHRDPAKAFARYVAERDGEVGAYGFSVRTDVAANKFRFGTYYLPEWETAELIDSFATFVMRKCLEYKPVSLIARAREDEIAMTSWLKDNGFRSAMRYPRSIFGVPEFEPELYADLKARVANQGVEIISLVELAKRDPGWQRRVYELEMLLSSDVPRPSDFSPPPFEKYAQTEFEAPDFMPELWLIAIDGDSYVGTTSLFKLGDNLNMLETGLTGVLRNYRRQGLATLLKCLAIERAQQLGAQLILTSNEENNPMYQLNLRLGFQPQPADVDWEKMLGA
jgi:GNAT superfamily N-acetyltransferase